MTDAPKPAYWGWGFERGTNERVFIDGNSPEEVQQNAMGRAYAVDLRGIFQRPEEPTP